MGVLTSSWAVEADPPESRREYRLLNDAINDLVKAVMTLHRFRKFPLPDGLTDELVERIEARQANKRAACEERDGTPRKRERNTVLRV